MDNVIPAGSHYLDDFAAGMTFRSHEIDVSAHDIIGFATQFDPQPFHLDANAAQSSFFGTLVASGWHTAALSMRLLVESDLAIAGGIVGAGAEITWPAALRPGQRIHVDIEIVEVRMLRSRPQMGMITTRSRTCTAEGTVVQELVAKLFVPCRPAVPAPEG